MYLLEAATNPILLTAGSDEGDDPGFLHPPLEVQGDEPIQELLAKYASFETPWKYQEVQDIVATAAENGEKVLIWTNFVRNIRMLSKHLSNFEPAMVHGGVDPGLLGEVQWWRTDDLWYWSLEALAVYVRAAAERSGQSAATIAHRIGARRGVVIP